MVPVIIRRGGSSDGVSSPPVTNVVALLILLVCTAVGVALTVVYANPVPALVAAAIGVVLMQSPKVASRWSKRCRRGLSR